MNGRANLFSPFNSNSKFKEYAAPSKSRTNRWAIFLVGDRVIISARPRWQIQLCVRYESLKGPLKASRAESQSIAHGQLTLRDFIFLAPPFFCCSFPFLLDISQWENTRIRANQFKPHAALAATLGEVTRSARERQRGKKRGRVSRTPRVH